MKRLGWRGAAAGIAFGIAAATAHAGPAPTLPEWASWVATSSNLATGTFPVAFPGSVEVTLSGVVAGVDVVGDGVTSSPPIPGQPGGERPPGVIVLTGSPHPGTIDPGAFIMAMDLSGIPPTHRPILAFEDMMCCRSYRLELLDASFAALPLDGVVVDDYNLSLPGGYLADFNVTLNPTSGALRVYNYHDGFGDYDHTGFTTFANLPAGTRHVRVTSDSLGIQPTEGVHFFLAVDVPEPGAGAAELGAITALAMRWRSRRRRVRF